MLTMRPQVQSDDSTPLSPETTVAPVGRKSVIFVPGALKESENVTRFTAESMGTVYSRACPPRWDVA